MNERRQPSTLESEKFATQKLVTYILLMIFAAVVTNVLSGADQAERSMLLQTVINLTLLAVGYWLGSSKGAIDSNTTIGQIAQSAAPTTALAVAASRSDPVPPVAAPIVADNVSIDTNTTTITPKDAP